MDSITEIRDKLASGNTGAVVRWLVENGHKCNKDVQDEIVIQAGRWSSFEKDARQGLLSSSELEYKRNQITVSILEIVNNLPNSILQENGTGRTVEKVTRGKKKFSRLIVGLIVAITLALGYYYQDIIFSGKCFGDVTIFVHGLNGQQDIVLENKGELIIDLKNDRRVAKIGEHGRTNFEEIPCKVTRAEIGLRAFGYVPVDSNRVFPLNGEPIYYSVTLDPSLATISGYVKDSVTLLPLEGANVRVDERF